MSTLAFCCPVTSQVLQCDFDVDALSLKKLKPLSNVHVTCPHCHLLHVCVVEDALVMESEMSRAGLAAPSDNARPRSVFKPLLPFTPLSPPTADNG